jgi:hypothetical protein
MYQKKIKILKYFRIYCENETTLHSILALLLHKPGQVRSGQVKSGPSRVKDTMNSNSVSVKCERERERERGIVEKCAKKECGSECWSKFLTPCHQSGGGHLTPKPIITNTSQISLAKQSKFGISKTSLFFNTPSYIHFPHYLSLSQLSHYC